MARVGPPNWHETKHQDRVSSPRSSPIHRKSPMHWSHIELWTAHACLPPSLQVPVYIKRIRRRNGGFWFAPLTFRVKGALRTILLLGMGQYWMIPCNPITRAIRHMHASSSNERQDIHEIPLPYQKDGRVWPSRSRPKGKIESCPLNKAKSVTRPIENIKYSITCKPHGGHLILISRDCAVDPLPICWKVTFHGSYANFLGQTIRIATMDLAVFTVLVARPLP